MSHPGRPAAAPTSRPADLVIEQVTAVLHRLDVALRPGEPMAVGGPWHDAQKRVEEHVLKGRGALESLVAGASGADRDQAIAGVRTAFDASRKRSSISPRTSGSGIRCTRVQGSRCLASGAGRYLSLLGLVDWVAHSPRRNPKLERALLQVVAALVPKTHPGRKGATASPLAGRSPAALDTARRDLTEILRPVFPRGRGRRAAAVIPDPWEAGLNDADSPNEAACRVLARYLGFDHPQSWRTIQTALNTFRRTTRPTP
jgi:hypothetical protein